MKNIFGHKRAIFLNQAGQRAVAMREVILLVVLVVVLTFALSPLLRKQKATSSSVVALNNLVQWGIALNLYLIDHDNRLPLVGPSEADPELKDAWYNALPPYLSQAPFARLVSPGFNRADNSAIIWSDPSLAKIFGKSGDVFIFPYAMNRYLQPQADQPAYAVYDLQMPRSVIFLAESASTDPGILPAAVSYRHSRKMDAPTAISHALFVDGHAERTTREVLSKEPSNDPQEKLPSISWLPFPGAPAPNF